MVLVDYAVLAAAAAIGQVLSHAPFEEALAAFAADSPIVPAWEEREERVPSSTKRLCMVSVPTHNGTFKQQTLCPSTCSRVSVSGKITSGPPHTLVLFSSGLGWLGCRLTGAVLAAVACPGHPLPMTGKSVLPQWTPLGAQGAVTDISLSSWQMRTSTQCYYVPQNAHF